ncbi:uncharacterized protein LOC135143475 [Zophobas morio]|uniref:uncharacterized protein LOC135143475 n=1 Tax=Zophobas morio TaxID=2755281 RepID=UPI003082F3CF
MKDNEDYELLLGDIPPKYASVKVLDKLFLRLSLSGESFIKPYIRNLNKKGYRGNIKKCQDNYIVQQKSFKAGFTRENSWFGYAILTFESPQEAKRAQIFLNGVVVDETFTLRVVSASMKSIFLVSAGFLSDDSDPPILAQLYPLSDSEIQARLFSLGVGPLLSVPPREQLAEFYETVPSSTCYFPCEGLPLHRNNPL